MSASGQAPLGSDRVGSGSGPGQDGKAPNPNIATAITDVSERALLLVHEEIELAKAEISEKIGKLLKGTVVAVAAGVFVIAALQFVLVGFALLAWWGLPSIGQTEFFWGFFLVAGVLLLMALLAGLIAARAVKAGSPPVPSMALEEARKIRGSVASGPAGTVDGSPTGAGAPGSGPSTKP